MAIDRRWRRLAYVLLLAAVLALATLLREESSPAHPPRMTVDEVALSCMERLFSGNDSGPNTQPTDITNLFFIKVMPVRPTLDGDELCGLESAMRAFSAQQLARTNITVCVYLLTTSDFVPPATVASLERFYGMRLNVLIWEDYIARWRAAGTLPHMLNWLDSGVWRKGFVLNNLSNGMRLVLVYNHGGAYFDLDIAHATCPRNTTNFISWQTANGHLNNAALRFQRHYEFLDVVSRRFAEKFDGETWGHNGPKRLTETYREFCKPAAGGPPAAAWCTEMQFFLPQSYYPVFYKNRSQLYNKDEGRLVQIGPNTFGVHLWKAVRKRVSTVEPGSIFHKLAQNVCPVTLIELGLDGLAPSEFAEKGKQQVPEAIPVLPSGTAQAAGVTETKA